MEKLSAKLLDLISGLLLILDPQEKVVGIEIFDASEILDGIKGQKMNLENLVVETY